MALVTSTGPYQLGIQPVRVIDAPFTDEAEPTEPSAAAWIPVVDRDRGKAGSKLMVLINAVDGSEHAVFGATATITAYSFIAPARVGLGEKRPWVRKALGSKTAVDLDKPVEIDVVPSSRVELQLSDIVAVGATKISIGMTDLPF